MARRSILFIPALLAFCLGCGGSSAGLVPLPCHPAAGSLFIGGKPAAGATIVFRPTVETPDMQVPYPRATIGPDGTFQLSTYGANDGAPVGEYGFTVAWAGDEGGDRLKGKYESPEKTAKTVKIVAGDNKLPPIKLP